MTAAEIVKQLKTLGKDSYKKVLLNHGVREPVFGASIEEMKKILKKTGMDYRLALELYDTGIYDAMYLAGLMADDAKMTRRDLEHWVETAPSSGISDCTVPWVAAGSRFGRELALEWIDSPSESVASSGWATLSSLVSITADANLDVAELKRLLARVQKSIHQQPNKVRSTMNHFVIAVGSFVTPLTELAVQTGAKIGPVTIDVGKTACKIPYAPDYIEKVRKRGSIGKKRKTAKC